MKNESANNKGGTAVKAAVFGVAKAMNQFFLKRGLMVPGRLATPYVKRIALETEGLELMGAADLENLGHKLARRMRADFIKN